MRLIRLQHKNEMPGHASQRTVAGALPLCLHCRLARSAFAVLDHRGIETGGGCTFLHFGVRCVEEAFHEDGVRLQGELRSSQIRKP